MTCTEGCILIISSCYLLLIVDCSLEALIDLKVVIVTTLRLDLFFYNFYIVIYLEHLSS